MRRVSVLFSAGPPRPADRDDYTECQTGRHTQANCGWDIIKANGQKDGHSSFSFQTRVCATSDVLAAAAGSQHVLTKTC